MMLSGATVPLFLTKVIFVNRLKPLRKYWGYGGKVMLLTIHKFQSGLSQVVLKDRI